jgi:uncharacterized protein YdaU (DUF1376 family)
MAALPYIQLYTADYLADTAHLTTIQHGAYLLLIFNYWQRGQPLNNANGRLASVVRMSNDEWAIHEQTLAEFFEVNGDEWVNHRIDEDLEAVKAKSTKASVAGKASGARRRAKAKRTPNVRSTNADRTVNHTEADTDTEADIKAAPIVPAGDADAVLSAYHAALPQCLQIAVLNPKRKRRIADAVKLARQVCTRQGWPYEPADFWAAYFGECANDPWLRGERANPNNPNWKQNLDVLLAEDRFAEIMDKAIAAMRGTP